MHVRGVRHISGVLRHVASVSEQQLSVRACVAARLHVVVANTCCAPVCHACCDTFNSSAADGAIDFCSVLACCNNSHLQENRVGFVVRASVFGWRTFADLCLIYGRHVITSWVVSAIGQPTRPTQPSIPSGKRAVIHIITWITRFRPYTVDLGCLVVWPQGQKSRVRGA